jgi:MFS family permease
MTIVFITLPGTFIVAMLLTQTFPLRDAVFGAIASRPAWCNVIQILVVPFLTKRWSQKSIALTFSWFHLAVWVAIGFALPLVPRDDLEKAGGLFFVLFALSAMSHAVVGVSWTSWVQEWVPDRLRGNYFGRRNRLLQLSTVLFLLLAGELLTRFDARESVVGFQFIVGLAVFLRVFSILAQQRILATSVRQQTEGRHDTGRQLRLIFQNKPIVWLFGFGGAFGFVAKAGTPIHGHAASGVRWSSSRTPTARCTSGAQATSPFTSNERSGIRSTWGCGSSSMNLSRHRSPT